MLRRAAGESFAGNIAATAAQSGCGILVRMATVVAKLGSMRKAREWSVRPASDDRIIVQAEGAIGIFDWRHGIGALCTGGGTFAHLAVARPFTFPPSFVQACLRECPSLGGETVHLGGAVVERHEARQTQGARLL